MDLENLSPNETEKWSNSNCSRSFIPTTKDVLEAFGPSSGGVAFYFAMATLLVMLIAIFASEIRFILWNAPLPQKSPTILVLAAYPVVGLTTFLSIIVPRSTDFQYAAGQMWLAVSMSQFYRLTMVYLGGDTQALVELQDEIVDPAVGPCCCFCCCRWWCKKVPQSRSSMIVIRLLISQLPLTQALLFIVSETFKYAGFYKSRMGSATDPFVYLSVLQIAASLSCVYGFTMLVNLCREHLNDQRYVAKYRILWVIVPLKVQDLIFRQTGPEWPCVGGRIPGQALAIMCSQILMLVELVIISFIAWSFYRHTVVPKTHKSSRPLKKKMLHFSKKHHWASLCFSASFPADEQLEESTGNDHGVDNTGADHRLDDVVV